MSPSGQTHHFTPTRFYYTFGPHEPALRIHSGDTVITSTADAGSSDSAGESLPPERRHTDPDTELAEANPEVGPFYVEEAAVGDTLAVHIRSIEINRPTAYSRFGPGFGALGVEDGRIGPMGLNEPLPTMHWDWALDLEKQTARMELPNSRLGSVEIPLHPFLGCIATAPRFGEVHSTMAPGNYGGNMDCVDTKAGATVYLPVFVKGAYLFLGDVHAAQGDGEICGVALETTADVTFSVEVIKDKRISWPRLEDDQYIMTAGNTRPLIDAFRIAHVEMVRWLVADYGFDQWEAFELLSQVGRARVGNVVDPLYTVLAKFPKQYLPK